MPIQASAAQQDRPVNRMHLARRVPRSLMQRLALLECDRLQEATRQPQIRLRSVGMHFALGLAAGGVLGGAVLLILLGNDPGRSIIHAAVALPPNAGMPATVDVERSRAIKLTVRADERQSTPFPQRITGADAGDNNLHLSMRDGSPAAFDVKIDVASTAGTHLAATEARVRLIDAAPKAAQARATETPFASSLKADPLAQGPLQAASPLARSRPGLEASVALVREPPAQPARDVRPRPEGASALGGPMGDTPTAPAQDNRQVWWKMPAPAWAPFHDGSDRR